MNNIEKINQEIDELIRIKSSINEIKKTYQDMNSKIELKSEIKKMIDLLDKIYLEIFENSQHLQLFRLYGDFYLPTISKLISKYKVLKNKNIQSPEIQELLRKIEFSIPKLNNHFQNKYNSFFENEIIDLDSDIKVLLQELNIK